MREIKFRVWDRLQKIMAKVSYIKFYSDYTYPQVIYRYKDKRTGRIIDERANFGADDGCDTTRVMQYTGLKDVNGKEIYEGDIVRYQFDNDDCPFPNKHTEKIIGRIFFSEHRASFSVTAGKNCSDMLNNDLFKYVRNGNRVEVIGNIYENPELLEG